MILGNVFRLQLAADFGNRRRIILRIGISLLLALPFIFVGMPARAQATGIVMVILFTGFFGAAVGFTRLRADLRFTRLTLLPIPRYVLWLDLVLASAIARLVPVIIVLVLFIIVNGQGITPSFLTNVLGLLFASMVLLTILGMSAGRMARTNGEVHLSGALICMVLAFFSGITPLPEKLTWLKSTMLFNPISRLLAALTGLAGNTAFIPKVEFVLASLIVGLVIVTVILRWISGGTQKT
jgi:ABC-type multidrug transport system permease subunit